MTVKDKIWIELYRWAIRYAKVRRNALVEVDDLAQEMMIAVMQGEWRSREYAKEVMRNKFLNLIRHSKVIKDHIQSLEGLEKIDPYQDNLEAKNLLGQLFLRMNQKQIRVLSHLFEGRKALEITKIEHISKMTVSRYIHNAREVLNTVG